MTHLDGQARAQYVQDMFGRIARRYDLMNRLMTFGQDNRWRAFVIRQAGLPLGGSLLDLATGTGDVAFSAIATDPTLSVIGADFALPMMQVGQTRSSGNRIQWCQGDALSLPFPNNTFDAVTSGYLLRNLVDLPKGLQEQVRVVKSGGMVVSLDTTPPPRNLLRPFIEIHLRYIIPLMGRMITGAPDAYAYLPESTKAFKSAEELKLLMADAGLAQVNYRKFMFGTMAVHWGRKP